MFATVTGASLMGGQNIYRIYFYQNLYSNADKFTVHTLKMFAGIYRVFTGKSECGDFKFMGIACIPAISAKIIRKFEKNLN